jgi:endonuclease I
MQKILFFSILLLFSVYAFGQPIGYYNGSAGKTGDDLKTSLHQIIKGHVDYSYSQAKFIINYSDADPDNPKNVILFYTQRSQDANTYGTGGDFINREHVWAKSHGTFANIRPMDGDAFNLRPADASVNQDRSNKDFGNVQPNGTRHPEATECWYNASFWEPGAATKGQVARIIFYMATRYEGTDGELDLEVVNGGNTYPKPQHGDLAALLEWNRLYPPTDFERRRNERIFGAQQNRNPFIDNPEFADLIWASATPNPIVIDQLKMVPQFPKVGETINISASITADKTVETVKLFWGKQFDSEDNQVTMVANGSSYSASFTLTGFSPADMLHFKILAQTADNENLVRATHEIPQNITVNQLTSISSVQGTGNVSPLVNQIVTVAGRVVANYDNSFYIQQGTGPYSGLCIFGANNTGKVGDSLVITGKVVEYENLTELSNITYCYNFKDNKTIEPTEITASQIGEAYEGMLVKIKNTIFSNGGEAIPDANKTYPFTDASGSSVVFSRYSSRLFGKTLPRQITDVAGVVSQYQNTYQILPRDILDFSAGVDDDAPFITKVSMLDKEWITIEFNEVVEKISSEKIENYTFSNNITPLAAYRYDEGNAVVLQVTNMSLGAQTVTINGITDMSGNTMQNVSFNFESVFTNINTLANYNSVKITPNQLTQSIEIESDKMISQLEIFNSSGQLITRNLINQKQVSHTMTQGNGLYILRIQLENGFCINRKILMQ